LNVGLRAAGFDDKLADISWDREPVMVISKMNTDACREVLARASMGRLGCSLNNQPYVVPVGLAYEANDIHVFSTFGHKIKWMRENPKVCIQIDEIAHDQSQWVSVLASGQYEELTVPEFEQERDHARRLLEERRHFWLNAFAARRLKSESDSIVPLFFRIRIDSVTGLFTRPEDDAP